MKFIDLVNLCENEKVSVLYPLGYNTPETKVGVNQNRDPKNNTNQTPGMPNAYPAEDEMERAGIVVGTVKEFINSNSTVGLYSFNTKYTYWNKLKGDQVSELINLMTKADFIDRPDPDELVKEYNFAKLTKNQDNTIDIEKKSLTDIEKKHIISKFLNLNVVPNIIS